jgi:restriction system protein
MYGVPSEGTQHIGQSGDQGIDGIVALDKLGFDKIYIQAKRWQANVGGPDVQKFIGALSQKKAQKGVFITTSLFTPDARIAAKSQSPPIVLIDGPALCKLMIEHGVGVERRQIHVPGFSLDYFGLSA